MPMSLFKKLLAAAGMAGFAATGVAVPAMHATGDPVRNFVWAPRQSWRCGAAHDGSQC